MLLGWIDLGSCQRQQGNANLLSISNQRQGGRAGMGLEAHQEGRMVTLSESLLSSSSTLFFTSPYFGTCHLRFSEIAKPWCQSGEARGMKQSFLRTTLDCGPWV